MRLAILWHPLTGALLLVTPAVSFLGFQDYGFGRAETFLFLGLPIAAGAALGLLAARLGGLARVVVIAALVALFVDFQFHESLGANSAVETVVRLGLVFAAALAASWLLREHAAEILAGAMATALIATIVVPPERDLPKLVVRSDAPPANPQQPLVLHLVFDEHQGVEGIPAAIAGGSELKETIKAFYARYGFRLFGKAYSHFHATQLAISSLMSLAEDPVRHNVEYGGGTFRWEMMRNALFERLNAAGYQIKVYQSDFMDVCRLAGAPVASCYTYPCCTLKTVEGLPLSAAAKFEIVLGAFLEPVISYRIVRTAYRALGRLGLDLPPWDWEKTKYASLTAFDVLERMKADLATAAAGQYYYAHLFLPHFPYVYTADCSLYPPERWLMRWSEEGKDRDRWGRAGPGASTKNTPATREERYRRYFEQTRCLYRRLGDLFEAMKQAGVFDSAVIVVQGDHGSRLTLEDPDAGRPVVLAEGDRVDSYSALFAVRLPGVPGGYDSRLVSLQTLFARLAAGGFRSMPDLAAAAAESSRRLFPSGPTEELRMMDFGDGAAFRP